MTSLWIEYGPHCSFENLYHSSLKRMTWYTMCFLNTQYMRFCDIIHIALCKIRTKWFKIFICRFSEYMPLLEFNYSLINCNVQENFSLKILLESTSQLPQPTFHQISLSRSTSTRILYHNKTNGPDTDNPRSLMKGCPSQPKESNHIMRAAIFCLIGMAIIILIIYFIVEVRVRQKVKSPTAFI